MKKALLLATLIATCLTGHSQYQLPNPGFEQWDGMSATAEPEHWNSFATSDGTFAGMASAPHHYHRSGGRPGSDGSSYLTIYAKSVVGVTANGNMTTGCIHAGGMSASSSSNYNYTKRSNSAHCQPFSGTPDSMYVWVSFYAASASSKAQISAILHGNTDFKSPNEEYDPSLSRATAKALIDRTTTSATAMQWQQIKAPFIYTGGSSVNYILVNITTNANAGEGNPNDSLSVDDIEFIYSAWLTAITVGGSAIADFDKGVMDYTVHVDDLDAEVNAVTEVADATMAFGRQVVDDTTVLVTIDVTAEDNVTLRHYTVTLTTGAPAVGIDSPSASGKHLAVYPNPTADKITVVADGTVEICNLEGQTLLTHPANGQATIDLSPIPSGLYLVRCGHHTATVLRR